MSQPLKVGVLGVGNMGNNHLRVLSTMHEFELVGCFDPDLELAEKRAAEYGIKAFQSQDLLFESVEVVHVVVPSFLHKECAVAAAQAGCHVLVEKPIALTLNDAQIIIDACNENGVKLCVGHVERFNPAIVALADVLEAEEIISVDLRRMSPFDSRVSDASVIQDLMIHDADVLNWLAGANVKNVLSQTATVYTDKPDFAQALVEFDNGILASLTASRITESKVRVAEINARDAFIVADYLNRTVTVYRKTHYSLDVGHDLRYRQDSIVERVFVQANEPLRAEFKHFSSAIQKNEPIQTSGEMGMKALELCLAIENNATCVKVG